jgi:hypothetical protein
MQWRAQAADGLIYQILSDLSLIGRAKPGDFEEKNG